MLESHVDVVVGKVVLDVKSGTATKGLTVSGNFSRGGVKKLVVANLNEQSVVFFWQ